MGKTYYDAEHASQRLTGCVLKIDGDWVRVSEVQGRRGSAVADVLGYKVGDPGNITSYSLTDCDIRSDDLKLGFVNELTRRRGRLLHIARYPTRTWKDGVASGNTRIDRVLQDGATTRSGMDDVKWRDLSVSPYMLNTLKGDYPDFDKAYKTVSSRDTVDGCAFSRRFAITKNEDLIFKRRGVVGIAAKSGPVLKDTFAYLKESLDEDLK